MPLNEETKPNQTKPFLEDMFLQKNKNYCEYNKNKLKILQGLAGCNALSLGELD